MSIEKRIERLERRRPVVGEQRVDTILICSTEEPGPTDEEIEVAKAEFIEKYGDRSLMMIHFIKGITSAGVNGKYVELPHSERLRELRTIRINNTVIIQPSQ
jgi:hypothetical protein